MGSINILIAAVFNYLAETINVSSVELFRLIALPQKTNPTNAAMGGIRIHDLKVCNTVL